jgi:hypothetical protein
VGKALTRARIEADVRNVEQYMVYAWLFGFERSEL